MHRARLHAVPRPVSLVLALALLVCCRPAPAQSPQETTAWQPLGRWSGRAPAQTDPFTSSTGYLRLSWEARPLAAASSRDARLRIAVHSDVSGRELLVAVDHRGPGRDVTYVSEDPRPFYLVIDAANLEWSVEVAEGVPARKIR